MIFFEPFLKLFEFIVPGDLNQNSITTHLAMLHTVFNTTCTLIFLPFVNQIAALVERIIKPGAHEPPPAYTLDFPTAGRENAEAFVFRAEREILTMSELVCQMFDKLTKLVDKPTNEEMVNINTELENGEEYADQMQEQLSAYLVKTSQLPLSDKTKNNVRLMLRIVDDLESMTDNIFVVGLQLQRSRDKKMAFKEGDMERLKPYIALARQFIEFVHANINKPLTTAQLETAQQLEDQIDGFRKDLKKIARKRLEEGADVKAELLYLDIVRNVEKLGDHAFSISEALAETR
jgi:phosphate:Na+ symporter